ncbi:pleckstrin homology domain-containing family G member 4B-like isoform X2 [Chiloscyllium punctatum]|uniref:pleckstrin homology domain-containing family G member 4B-like isoform X2 n=1 Tax=Chiloscyllium punctatum TaxID=137246 RepID=UPI003B63A1D2
MNSQSLDTCIQRILSALYPPFDATAPTVLSQIFRVIDTAYKGDGLCCLLDFLIPAKRILENVQQEACARYSSLLFRHEGWPLCLHEKVVIQLASFNIFLLRPGDFYLQILPVGRQTARIVLKCLGKDLCSVEEKLVPEVSYTSIFTVEWLGMINSERSGTPLHTCLLATENGVVKVLWTEIVNPEFVTKVKVTPASGLNTCSVEETENDYDSATMTLQTDIEMDRLFTAPEPDSHIKDDKNISPDLIQIEGAKCLRHQPVKLGKVSNLCEVSSENVEGDYVDLLMFSNEKCTDQKTVQPSYKNRESSVVPMNGTWACGGSIRFATEPCTPCLNRRINSDLERKQIKCRYRESYIEALQNPLNFGFSLQETETSKKNKVEATMNHKLDSSLKSPAYCRQNQEPKNSRKTTAALPSRETNEGRLLGHSIPHPTSFKESYQAASKCDAHLWSPSSDITDRHSLPDAQRSCLPTGDTTSSEIAPNRKAGQVPKKCSVGYISPRIRRHKAQGKDVSKEVRIQPDTPVPLSQRTETILQSPGASLTTRASPISEHHQKRFATRCLDLNGDLLHSGAACLPGSRDKAGRAVLQVCSDNRFLQSQTCTSDDLARLLLYLYNIPRKEVQDLGLTIVIDARRRPPHVALFKALGLLQDFAPHSIHCVLILTEKETTLKLEKYPRISMEVLTSLKALNKFIDNNQLTENLEGTLPYNHSEWIQFRMKHDSFVTNCREVSTLLLDTIQTFESNKPGNSEQEVTHCIGKHKLMMKHVLQDARLVTLQLEGGAILARLKKEESRFSSSEDYRDTIDAVTSLYNKVEEHVHTLVMRSNQCLQHLEFLQDLRRLEDKFKQRNNWLVCEGESHLQNLGTNDDSLNALQQTQDNFSGFFILITQEYKKGLELLQEVDQLDGSSYPEFSVFKNMVEDFKVRLNNFHIRAKRRRTELEALVNLYSYCNKATTMAEDCKYYLNQLGMCNEAMLENLESYHQRFTEFSVKRFQQMKSEVHSLNSTKGMKMWNVTWLKCQEVRQLLEEKLEFCRKILKSDSIPSSGISGESKSTGQNCSKDTVTSSSLVCGSPRTGDDVIQKKKEKCNPWSCRSSQNQKENMTNKPKGTPVKPLTFNCPLWLQSSEVSTGKNSTQSCSPPSRSDSVLSPCAQHKSYPSKKIMQAAQGFQLSRHASFCSEDNTPRNTPVDRNSSSAIPVMNPVLSRVQGSSLEHGPIQEVQKATKDNSYNKMQHIMEEILITEREYVRSLGYIVNHYFPEMERTDLPQDLRGQQGAIFGNLEKLYDFHSHYFLKELEKCAKEPIRVGGCFLRHEEQFGLYALYSKNKPRSDFLLSSHGNSFFRTKQLELGDKMDLASYLLKPIQRISKYNLLLRDMFKECGAAQEKECKELKEAHKVVCFQLRHGNDLLAMDDIQECDVNLKEQGQLLRQDEFVVWCGRRKWFRHVFLFEDLILFSKTRKIEGSNDIYIYKQSFKTSEIGMTHNSGESGLCFEIWFRRQKSRDTYIFHAPTPEIKQAWIDDLDKILWNQAVRNRELQMQERVFMGIGSKPFMDIKPSEAAINDRSVECVTKGKEETKRPNSIGSNGSASSSGSQSSSSSSGIGSLNMHSSSSPSTARSNAGINNCFYNTRACIEEDDLENGPSGRPFLTESLETSSQCNSTESVSGFSSSEHSSLSLTGGEIEEALSLCSASYKPSSDPCSLCAPEPLPMGELSFGNLIKNDELSELPVNRSTAV